MVYHVPNYKLCVSNGIKWMFHERGRTVGGPLLKRSQPCWWCSTSLRTLGSHGSHGSNDTPSGRCVLPSKYLGILGIFGILDDSMNGKIMEYWWLIDGCFFVWLKHKTHSFNVFLLWTPLDHLGNFNVNSFKPSRASFKCKRICSGVEEYWVCTGVGKEPVALARNLPMSPTKQAGRPPDHLL
jgi:hypothetical protein